MEERVGLRERFCFEEGCKEECKLKGKEMMTRIVVYQRDGLCEFHVSRASGFSFHSIDLVLIAQQSFSS